MVGCGNFLKSFKSILAFVTPELPVWTDVKKGVQHKEMVEPLGTFPLEQRWSPGYFIPYSLGWPGRRKRVKKERVVCALV